MRRPWSSPWRALVAAGAVLVALASACSSGNGGRAASTTAATTSPSASRTTEPATSTTTATTVPPYTSPVYSKPASWLCRPDARPDYCATNLDMTVVEADGSTRVERFVPAADAPFDCFYLYPTISEDGTPNSDMMPGAEIGTTRGQFARFASACRLFAPIYRQVTLKGLFGGGATSAWSTAYASALDAWKQYLANDNQGRGVVLIGHSQGASILLQLLQKVIEPDPAQRGRVISAVLAGTSVAVPAGKDVGGDLKYLPLCRSATQFGCVVTYASFRATAPPPANSFFGRPRRGGGVAGCVNPAAPGGGSAPLRPVFAGGTPALTDPAANARIATQWVSLPGLVTGRCVQRNGFSYLEITVNAVPFDPRIDRIWGDLTPQWGLHAIDLHLAQLDLIDLVASQAKAYLARG